MYRRRGSFDPTHKNHIERKPRLGKKAMRAAKSKAQASRLRSMAYLDYLNTPHWHRKREEAMRYHGAKCNRCGRQEALQVHHKSYQNLGREKMADLEVLCRGCHENEHEGGKLGVLDPMTREFISIAGS